MIYHKYFGVPKIVIKFWIVSVSLTVVGDLPTLTFSENSLTPLRQTKIPSAASITGKFAS